MTKLPRTSVRINTILQLPHNILDQLRQLIIESTHERMSVEMLEDVYKSQEALLALGLHLRDLPAYVRELQHNQLQVILQGTYHTPMKLANALQHLLKVHDCDSYVQFYWTTLGDYSAHYNSMQRPELIKEVILDTGGVLVMRDCIELLRTDVLLEKERLTRKR